MKAENALKAKDKQKKEMKMKKRNELIGEKKQIVINGRFVQHNLKFDVEREATGLLLFLQMYNAPSRRNNTKAELKLIRTLTKHVEKVYKTGCYTNRALSDWPRLENYIITRLVHPPILSVKNAVKILGRVKDLCAKNNSSASTIVGSPGLPGSPTGRQ